MKSLAELAAIREKMKDKVILREGSGDDADAVADVLRHFLSEEFFQRFGLWRRDEEWFRMASVSS